MEGRAPVRERVPTIAVQKLQKLQNEGCERCRLNPDFFLADTLENSQHPNRL